MGYKEKESAYIKIWYDKDIFSIKNKINSETFYLDIENKKKRKLAILSFEKNFKIENKTKLEDVCNFFKEKFGNNCIEKHNDFRN